MMKITQNNEILSCDAIALKRRHIYVYKYENGISYMNQILNYIITHTHTYICIYIHISWSSALHPLLFFIINFYHKGARLLNFFFEEI